ncbi:MAG: hypothetical protein ACRBN8_38865 [Nannocystales bacterium]
MKVRPRTPEPFGRTPIEEALLQLSELEFRITHWDTAAAEDSASKEALVRLVSTGEAIAEESVYILQGLSDGSPADASTRTPGAVPQTVADVAFVAAMETNTLRARLSGLEGLQEKWRVLETCQRTKRHVLRAVTSVAQELLGHTDAGDRTPRFHKALLGSLRCRRALSKFWHQVETNKGRSTAERLQTAYDAIAVLRRDEYYRELRINDRRVLHELRTRLLARLREDDGPNLHTDQLLQDVDGFVVLSRRINSRMELVDHDRAILRELERSLPPQDEDPLPLPIPLVLRLHQLQGLAPVLDSALFGRHTISTADLRRILWSLERWPQQEFDGHGSGAWGRAIPAAARMPTTERSEMPRGV